MSNDYIRFVVLIFVILLIAMEYFVGRGNHRLMVDGLSDKKIYGKPGRFLLMLSVIAHELAHLLGVIIFMILYFLTFWLPMSKHWYAKFIYIKFNFKSEKLGGVKFDGGIIARFFISIMPLSLIILSYIGIVIWINFGLGWKIVTAIPFFGLIFIPCLIGSLPSEEDLSVNSFLLIIPFAGYLGYLWFHQEALKMTIWFLAYVHMSLVCVIAMELIILYNSVIYWVNNGGKRSNFSWVPYLIGRFKPW